MIDEIRKNIAALNFSRRSASLELASRHLRARLDVPVIEDSCDTLGASLRGAPTGARSTISVTSFANRRR